MIIQSFYNRLLNDKKNILDSFVGCSFEKKNMNDGFKLLNEMTLNHKQWASTDRETPVRTAGMFEVDHLNLLLSKLEAISLKVDNIHSNTAKVQSANSVMCELCGIVGHTEVDCHMSIEQTSYVNNNDQKPHNEPFSNSYNPGCRNYPYFSYRKYQVQNLSPQNVPMPPSDSLRTSALETNLVKFIKVQA